MDETIRLTIEIAKAEERLRQEKETFDAAKRKDAKWFPVRLYMAYVALVLLPMIGMTCALIVFRHQDFAAGTVTIATSALFIETLGLMAWVWRTVLGRGPEGLAPVTSPVELAAAPVARRQRRSQSTQSDAAGV